MIKVKTSRTLNRYLGDKESGLMLCTRVYLHTKNGDRPWLMAEYTINTIFYIVRQETSHVRRTAIWELRYAQKANQSAVRPTKKETRRQQEAATRSQTKTKGVWEMTQLPLDLPPTDTDLLGHTTCDNPACNTSMPASQAVEVRKHTGRDTLQLAFCSEACANEYYLERLRRIDHAL